MSAKAPISETGIVTSGMSVARNERRKKKITSTTSTIASHDRVEHLLDRARR